MEAKFPKYPAGFCRNHYTQHALLQMIETWGSMQKKGKKVEAVVMDLSKAFDTLSDNFFLCKLKAYGFDVNALTLIQN